MANEPRAGRRDRRRPPAREKAAPSLPWLPYLQDLIGVGLDVAKQQTDRWNGIFEKMARREYTADEWVKDATWMWTEWVNDTLQVGASLQRSATLDAVPTTVIVLDRDAQGTDPKQVPQVPVTLRLRGDDKAAATPFTRIDRPGAPGIPAEKVRATLNERCDRLMIELQGIADLEPGYYLGWAYVQRANLPLAAIHVVKL